jgi:signal peptidase II
MVKYKFLKQFVLISIITIVLDQLIKFLIALKKPVWDLGIFTIEFISNTGAGFGILKDQTFWLAIISFIVAVVVIFYYKEIPQEIFPQILFALFLGGVIGNLIDRVVRSYVVDYINFGFFPAFNLADSAISIATIGLIYYFWKNK